MAIIYLDYRPAANGRHSATLQLETVQEARPNQECAAMILAIAGNETIALDFPNDVEKISGILAELRTKPLKTRGFISIKINTTSQTEVLQKIFERCGYTSQQFAIGSERQIASYLAEEDRIEKFLDAAPELTCIGQVECYKDRIQFTTNLSAQEIVQRLGSLHLAIIQSNSPA